jgi:hypothetical protein
VSSLTSVWTFESSLDQTLRVGKVRHQASISITYGVLLFQRKLILIAVHIEKYDTTARSLHTCRTVVRFWSLATITGEGSIRARVLHAVLVAQVQQCSHARQYNTVTRCRVDCLLNYTRDKPQTVLHGHRKLTTPV